MKLTTKQITFTALMLAICISSQFFKNASVYVTGPIVNSVLILTTLYSGLACGIIISIISPITAFFITGSPVMAAIPVMFPCIMLGNISLVVTIAFITNKIKKAFSLPLAMISGSIIKFAVMGILISLIVLPHMLPIKMSKMLFTLQLQFSITQLVTALIGSFYAGIILIIFKKIKK